MNSQDLAADSKTEKGETSPKAPPSNGEGNSEAIQNALAEKIRELEKSGVKLHY